MGDFVRYGKLAIMVAEWFFFHHGHEGIFHWLWVVVLEILLLHLVVIY